MPEVWPTASKKDNFALLINTLSVGGSECGWVVACRVIFMSNPILVELSWGCAKKAMR